MSCTVAVAFDPATTGAKAVTLRLAPAAGTAAPSRTRR
jgi:hypothetical protein